MTKQEHIEYWLATAAHDLDAAQSCFDGGKYLPCMNISHVALEKALKANWVRDSEQPVPRIYDLREIANGMRLHLSKEQKQFLSDLAIFDFEAPEVDYEFKALKLCTKEFTDENFTKVKELYHFLISQLQFEPARKARADA